MNRRSFLKTTSIVTAGLLLPQSKASAAIDFSRVAFDATIFNANAAQTIMVFLYGGASELAGNLSNIETIKAASQSSYDSYFNGITATNHGFWQEAGGGIMESLLGSDDLNVFRTCYSQVREDSGNRSHGECVSQNQRGVMHDNDSAGIFSILAKVLYDNGVINEATKLPFITMEGESEFFASPTFSLESFLKPTALSSDLSNPYERDSENAWFYYTHDERDGKTWEEYTQERPALDLAMDDLAQSHNAEGKIKENFAKRVELEAFIKEIQNVALPNGISYPEDNGFGEKLKAAVNIMSNNADTRIVSLGSEGLGGWDDHNEARDYTTRMEALFNALQAAMAHIKAVGKEESISIVVWGDFGRNVNLNSALGWDHGNLQNVYILGGKNYFNPVGVVGETAVEQSGTNRMYSRPAADAYWFEPASVAATLYRIYGITNPEYLTGGHGVIQGGLLR
jgi:hypothetical protein